MYDLRSDWVSQALQRPNEILILPFLFGGSNDAPAGPLGLKASHDLADVLRAVFEGIAFVHKFDIDKLLSGPNVAEPRVGRLGGGAASSPIWPQTFADVLGLPVEIPRGEFGAKGAAMSVAGGLGHCTSLEAGHGAEGHDRAPLRPRPAPGGRLQTDVRPLRRHREILGQPHDLSGAA